MRKLTLLVLLLPAVGIATECDADARTKAAAQLDALDARLESDSAAFEAAHAEFKALMADPCFSGPVGTVFTEPDSLWSLRQWWDAGGESALRGLIEPFRERADDSGPIQALFPPTFRPTLASDLTPKHAARALLCPQDDVQCGRVTAGWRLRAEHAGSPHGEIAPAALAKCEADAKAAGEADAYAKWVACVQQARPEGMVLPLGHFKAPDRGWLLIRGRRGHYSFCDGARLYHLESGAMYTAESCSRLALVSNGGVNHKATNAGRQGARSAGTVSVDNLREAAWMLVLHAHAPNGKIALHQVGRPEWITRKRGNSYFGFGASGWMSSAQTTLSWTWFADDGVLAEGTVRWPNSASLSAAHATRLLRIVEAGERTGCPGVAPPARIPTGDVGPGVSRLDARPQDVKAALDTAMRGLAAAHRAACASK